MAANKQPHESLLKNADQSSSAIYTSNSARDIGGVTIHGSSQYESQTSTIKQKSHSGFHNYRDVVAPDDKGNLVYITCLILGAGTLLAYNVIVTCSDYLITEFPDYPNIMFWIQPFYAVPDLIALYFIIRWGYIFSFTSRLVSMFIGTAIILGLVPIFVQDVKEPIAYELVLTIAALIGISAAGTSCTVIGFCNLLPIKYTQTAISGQAIAGIIACTIRILTKLLEPGTDKGTLQGGLIYFIVGGLFDFLCALAFLYAIYSPFVRHHLQDYFYMRSTRQLMENKEKQFEINKNKEVSIMNDEYEREENIDDNKQKEEAKEVEMSNSSVGKEKTGIAAKLLNATRGHKYKDKTTNEILYESVSKNSFSAKKNSTYQQLLNEVMADQKKHEAGIVKTKSKKKRKIGPRKDSDESSISYVGQPIADWNIVFPKIKWVVLAVFIDFFVTFLVFPGVLVGIQSQYDSINNQGWMPVLLITLFNVGDFIGRQFLASMTTLGFTEKTLWIGASWRVFIYPLFIVMYKGILISDAAAYLSTFVLALTNGMFGCLCFMWAVPLVDNFEIEMAASIVNTALVVGITGGSFTSLGLSYVF